MTPSTLRPAVVSELRKIATARSLLAFPVVAVLYVVASAAPAFLASDADVATLDGDALVGIVRGPGFFLAVMALLLGVMVAAGECRHGTIAATLLVTPRRRDVLVAKAVAVAAVAVAAAVAVSATALALGAVFLHTHGVASTAGASTLATAAGAVAAVAVLYGLAGVGLGALVREQTAAVATVLAWIGIVEGAIPVVLQKTWLFKWLPSGAANAVLGIADPPPDLLGPGAGAVILLGVAGVLLLGGGARLVGRDVP